MNLRKLIGSVLPQFHRELICERCGQPFTCGASLAACWCEEIKLSKATRDALRSSYQDCLCRRCLKQAAEAVRDAKSEQA